VFVAVIFKLCRNLCAVVQIAGVRASL
jgi:hypothetical protein